ncbi:MAG: glycerol-3-phosphate 1-O-acyltransferase PlsY [Defluviitaleaceae bacterium]|nr:glycerol-3-phosphate 1-O-acyltransferase PlsY [Defluviitaleaceae bacterium]
MYRLVALLIGYALGCVQTAYYIGKMQGIDIREHGSKNAGMTNVTRTLGKRFGAIVFAVDICKGILAFALAGLVFKEQGVLPSVYAGCGAVLGHCFPVLLKFRGGKGASCAVALILMLDWRMALIAFGIGAVLVAITRYISLGSLVVTALAPVLLFFFFDYGLEVVLLMVGLAALIWVLHRGNIAKLLNGTERKFLSKEL